MKKQIKEVPMLSHESSNRMFGILIIWGILLMLLLLSLCDIQIFKGQYYKGRADDQKKLRNIPGMRGTICDRNGESIAYDISSDTIAVIPNALDKPDLADSLVTSYLELPRGTLLKKIEGRNVFTIIAINVPKEKTEALYPALMSNQINGVEIRQGFCRVYPNHEVGANIIGFVGNETEGIERQFDKDLKGKAGKVFFLTDGESKSYLLPFGKYAPIPGLNVGLTIDINVQRTLDHYLQRAIKEKGGKAGMAGIINVKTGEILALSSYPTFDPNFFNLVEKETRRNRALTDPFEPGSIFKIITLAIVLEDNLFDISDTLFCYNGKFRFLNRFLTDVHPYGFLTVEDIIVKSSNIGTYLLSTHSNKQRLYEMARLFGFGGTYGIELPGESAGKVLKPNDWSGMTSGVFPFGKEVMVTTLQMLCAYATIANDGVLMKPYIMSKIFNSQGKVIRENKPEIVRRVISIETAKEMQNILEQVVLRGTGKAAQVNGLGSAGKTGTSPNVVDGRYSKTSVTASFVGFVPAKNATLAAIIVIDEPDFVFQYGGSACAPYFSELMTDLYSSNPSLFPTANNIAKDSIPLIVNNKVTIPDFCMMYKTQVQNLLSYLKLSGVFSGEGRYVINQIPSAKTETEKGDTIYFTLGEPQISDNKAVMPDLIGLSKREAVSKLSSLGIPIKVFGRGLVKTQDPTANSTLPNGGYCLIRCDILTNKDKQ